MAVVKVICKNLKANPQCPHGPTLRFVRVQNDREQEFYACSTYRDRKDCGFYLVVGDKSYERLTEAWEQERKRLMPAESHEALEERLSAVKQVPPTQRLYCHTCSQLDLLSHKDSHRNHLVQTVITDSMLANPSKLLKPKEGSRKEAQFLFNEATIKVIVGNLLLAKVMRVLCLGTP